MTSIENLLCLDPTLMETFEVVYNFHTGIIASLGGQFKASPEFYQDMHAYYGIQPADLLSFTREAIDKAKITGEVDLHVELVQAYHFEDEAIFKISVVLCEDKSVIRTAYFSTLPLLKAAAPQ